MQLLKGVLNKWLPLNHCDLKGVIDQILLEQFMWDLHEDMQRWVCRHQPHNYEEALMTPEASVVSKSEWGRSRGLSPPNINEP